MDDKVVPLNIKPATHRHHHDGFKVVVTYNVETKRWEWTVDKPVVSRITWSGEATTAGRALAEAKKWIDNRG